MSSHYVPRASVPGWIDHSASADGQRGGQTHQADQARHRHVARDQDMAKRLAHLPVINTGVLELACQPQLLGLVTPALLNEIAASDEERLHGSAVHLLADLVDTLRRMNERPRFGGIRTLAGLHERAQAINAAHQRHMLMREEVWATLKFPPPPVPGTNDIVPLTEPRHWERRAGNSATAL